MSFTYEYPRPALTVDALVFAPISHEWVILLIQRGREPFKGKWALPGGFINMEETLMQACIRELEEETGLHTEKMELFNVFDAPGRDPRGRTISVVYFTYLPEIVPVAGNDDAAIADWFPVSKLPPLAFDHDDIVRKFSEIYF
jgi:8-oxo-dGTP diphosphatase